MILAFLIAVTALCALLPSRHVVAGLPAIYVLERLASDDSARPLVGGPLHLQIVDIVLLLLLAKFAFSLVVGRELTVHRPLYLAIGTYLVVNLFATLVAQAKFGDVPLLGSLTSLLRLGADVLVVPIAAQAIRTLPQARRCLQVLVATLAVLAVIQFVNFVGASRGFTIGEVQGLERGEQRYFGPVGDSVGVVLLLGYMVSLCSASVVGVVAFLGGILLTAGIGAIFAAGVGTALFLALGLRAAPVQVFMRRNYWVLPLLVFAALGALAANPFAQTLLDRVGSGRYADSSGQRLASATMAGEMIAHNPVFGVGYMGYERALGRYGGEQFFDLAHPDGGTANANNQILQAFTDGGVPGFAAFAVLIFVAARLLRGVAMRCDDPFVSTFYLAAFLWLLTLVFGNLAAVWLVPSSFTGKLLWTALGLAVAIERHLPGTATAALTRTPAGRLPQPVLA